MCKKIEFLMPKKILKQFFVPRAETKAFHILVYLELLLSDKNGIEGGKA